LHILPLQTTLQNGTDLQWHDPTNTF
jgi:hypothetical protein